MDPFITGAGTWLLNQAAGKVFDLAANHLLKKMGLSQDGPNIKSLLDHYQQQLVARMDEDRISKLYGALSQLKDAPQTVAKREYLANALGIFHIVSQLPEKGMTGGRMNRELRCVAFLGMAAAHIELKDAQQLTAEKIVEAVLADSATAEQWIGKQAVETILAHYPQLSQVRTPVALAQTAKPPVRSSKSSQPIGTILSTFTGHQSAAAAVVAWSPDGTRIASGATSRRPGILATFVTESLLVWNVSNGRVICKCQMTNKEDSYGVTSLAWSPDGNALVSRHSSRKKVLFKDDVIKEYAQIWDANTGRRVRAYETSGTITAVAWAPGGKYVASGLKNGKMHVWEANSGRIFYTYYGNTRPVQAVAWSPDGSLMASCSGERVHVWGTLDGKTICTYQGHSKTITAISWSPDSKRLVSGSEDKTVQIWEATSGRCVFTYNAQPNTFPVTSVAWSPDGQCIASSSGPRGVLQTRGSHTMQIRDALNGRLIYTYDNHNASLQITAIAWSPDGTRIASSSSDGTVRVWQAV